LAVCIYIFSDVPSGQNINISQNNDHAISIPIETGVRDFSFSADGSALAVVDYHGDILLWALCSDPEFSEFCDTSRLKSKLNLSKAKIKYTLPKHLNPCSVQFLDLANGNNFTPSTPLLLVGSSYNRRLHLIDIGRGILLQEIVVPSIESEIMPVQNFSTVYTKEKGFLTVGDTISNSIFFFHLHTPACYFDSKESQSDYLVNIAETTGWRDSQSSDGILPAFDYVTEIPFFPHHRLQSLAVTPSMDAVLDVFTAHSNGFTMLSPNKEDILPSNYLEAKPASTTKIPTPELEREIYIAGIGSRNCTPSSKALSRRSSSESVQNTRETKHNPINKASTENLRRKATTNGQQSLVSKIPDTRNDNSDVTTEDSSPSRNASDNQQSPSPISQSSQAPLEKQNQQAPPGFQDLLNQALEQQCLMSFFQN
jgi:hypothetical protein